MIKGYYSTLCLFFLFSMGFSQSITVSGTVRDSVTMETLPFVSIYEKGTSNGVLTDLEGVYNIPVSSDTATLVFSYVGYKKKEQKINKSNTISVLLIPEVNVLKELVITAFNQKRDNRDLGYAVQKIESKDVSEVKSPNFVDNLAGRIAGVSVSQGATGVGSTSKITIRGESSFSNNNPLFIIDGIPINNNSPLNFSNESASGFQEVDFGNGAMEINQDDIENVTVLKGPSAAALYGTRAANGVVIITTKKGVKKNGIGVSFNTTTFIESPFKLPKFQNKYGQGNSGQFQFVDGLGGGINDNITYSWGPRLDEGIMIQQFDSPVTMVDGTIVRGGDVAVRGGQPISTTPFISHPDNLKNFYKTGITTINNAAISSSNEKGSYRVSFTDLRSISAIPGVNLDRNTISTNLVFTPSPKLKVSSVFNYVNSRSDNRPANGYGSENINYALVAWGPRSLNIENLKDYWQPGLEQIQQYSYNYTFFDNPYFTLLENRNSFNRDRLFGNFAISYDFTKNLSLTVSSGMDYSSELRKYLRNFSSNRFLKGAYAEQDVFFRELNSNFLLNYHKKIGKITLDFSAGGNRMDQEAATRQTEALSLAQPGVFNFSNAASPLIVNQFEARKRINSFYGLAKLGYRNILFLDITGRNDWSSALASPISTQNTSFFYPSFSASYIVSNNLKLPSWISFAKLRASWAQVGNDTDPYQTSSTFVAGTPYNSQPTFTAQNILANSNLLPERTTGIELGYDIRFIADRLRIDFTYYNSRTQNQIIALPVPISSGYSQQLVNGGSVRTNGIEVIMGITPIRKSNFKWNTLFNFSRNISTVEQLPEGADKITLAYSRVYDNQNQTVWFQVEEGGRIGDMYGTGYLKNENGDFIIDANGNFIADNTLKKIGNYNPDFILGFINEFEYKNWSFNFLFDWHQGGEIVSRTLALAAVGGQLIETENRPADGIVADGVVNVGTTANPIWEKNTTAISAESYYRQFYDRNHEENNVYDVSYLKLRQFALGYTFKANKNKGLLQDGRSLKISLIGRNLWAWSKIPHFDPEQLAVQGNRFVNGVEDMSYPAMRSFGLKIGYDF